MNVDECLCVQIIWACFNSTCKEIKNTQQCKVYYKLSYSWKASHLILYHNVMVHLGFLSMLALQLKNSGFFFLSLQKQVLVLLFLISVMQITEPCKYTTFCFPLVQLYVCSCQIVIFFFFWLLLLLLDIFSECKTSVRQEINKEQTRNSLSQKSFSEDRHVSVPLRHIIFSSYRAPGVAFVFPVCELSLVGKNVLALSCVE